MLYRVEVAIESAMDIVAMVIYDKGRTVSDDYHNLEQLASLKIITSPLEASLKRLNGLRNAIVNKYNRFEEETVIKHTSSIQKALLDFLQRVEHELPTIFGQNTK